MDTPTNFGTTLRPSAPQEEVNLYFNETPTIFIFQQKSSISSFTDSEAEGIQKENDTYRDYLLSVPTSENFSERGNFTFHNFSKQKETQTTQVLQTDQATQLFLYNLAPDLPVEKKSSKVQNDSSAFVLLHESAHPLSSFKWPSTVESILLLQKEVIDFGPGSEESNSLLYQMKNVDSSLFIIERMVQQNSHLGKILSYSSSKSNVEQPSVEILLKFVCPLTQNRPVTDVCFNFGATNFFAVSYSQNLDSPKGEPKNGLIVIWNILNPGYPERILETDSIPTTIMFSEGVPYLLAVGFSDGSVGLFDIRTRKCTCIALSTVETGSHEGPVGEIVFQQRTDTRIKSEAIVSVASGGRVTQWTVANGLEHKDLVTLKKLKTAGKTGETQTLRYEDLHCVSFNTAQPNIYVVGSEDGALFVCDSQYNEDFITKLLYHFRSVFAIKFSPIVPGYFLSASCDGSIAMWHVKRATPLSVFHSTKASFNDVDWSPMSSTVFAAASSDGECRIWDVSLDSVDPIATLKTSDKKEFTCLDFAPDLPVFIAGNSVGVVQLAKVTGVPSLNSGNDHSEEKNRFDKVVQTLSNQE